MWFRGRCDSDMPGHLRWATRVELPKASPLGKLRSLWIGIKQSNWVTKPSVEGGAIPSTEGGWHLNLFPFQLHWIILGKYRPLGKMQKSCFNKITSKFFWVLQFSLPRIQWGSYKILMPLFKKSEVQNCCHLPKGTPSLSQQRRERAISHTVLLLMKFWPPKKSR